MIWRIKELVHNINKIAKCSSFKKKILILFYVFLGDFKMYDHGVIQNFARYGQGAPPSYNLNKIVAPVAIFYGKGDTLISPSVRTLEYILFKI